MNDYVCFKATHSCFLFIEYVEDKEWEEAPDTYSLKVRLPEDLQTVSDYFTVAVCRLGQFDIQCVSFLQYSH